MLDAELAFPDDFMFRLSESEVANLRLQNATSNPVRGGRRYYPLAFTEHGAVMLAAVLNTPVAVQASVAIARAFVQLRAWAMKQAGLTGRLKKIENRLASHDDDIETLFKAMRALEEVEIDPPKEIGFKRNDV